MTSCATSHNARPPQKGNHRRIYIDRRGKILESATFNGSMCASTFPTSTCTQKVDVLQNKKNLGSRPHHETLSTRGRLLGGLPKGRHKHNNLKN